jgi:hypothetical protein
MEQQQNELFTMIGELTYRLQLAQRENERLADENQTMCQERRDMVNEYNMTFDMYNDLRSENALLRARLAEEERIASQERNGNNYYNQITNDQMTGLYGEEPVYGGRPQRETSIIDHALLMTNEQMDGFYGQDPMGDGCLQRESSNLTIEMLMTDKEIEQYYGEDWIRRHTEWP